MPFIDDIASALVAASVGSLNSSIFIGPRAIIPPGDGPYLTLIETGGLAPTRKQNINAASTQRPTAQITVRATSRAVARATARNAYLALDGVFNTILGGAFYLSITARQEPTDMIVDGDNRAVVVFNIQAEKGPS